MTRDAKFWIKHLGLERHPEGGFFRETYRSEETIPACAMPERYDGARPFSTAIYFLLSGNEFSAFHRIKSDELWHFYVGDCLSIHIIDHDGFYSKIRLGVDCTRGESLQAMVKGGCWFAASLDEPQSYALVGCTVAPGFDYEDFEMADKNELILRYPQYASIIARLTRSAPAGV